MKRRWPMIVRIVIGIVVGGLLGFAVYRFIGCSTGTCPITSNPWISTLFGMLIGGLSAKGF
jgi:ABC-type xylose transport system permease subunit